MSRATAMVAVAAVAGACAVGAAPGAPRGISGSWVGTYTLGGVGEISVGFSGARATVALGAGHAGVQVVPVSAASGGVRFQLPGRPAALVFNVRLRGRTLVGTVAQGGARGAFRATRGRAFLAVARGIYAGGGKTLAVADDPYGPERLVDLDSGEVHALYSDGAAFRIGAGFATRDPASGSARFDAAAARLGGVALPRVRSRAFEVRFRSGDVVLSGTLTLPPGAGRHPAVAWVHGSGSTTRAYLPDLQALLLRHGVAVLAYDKRGVGQSGGRYPGESPTQSTIDVLARDAAAATRFLSAQPEVDRARVGLAGHSQAGWVMPLAATREPRVRFLVAFAGPVVTADENDLYQTLAGQGETPQRLTDDEVDAQVLAHGLSGVDPMPWIRRLTVPQAWYFGELDKHIPTRLSVARLDPLVQESGRDLTVSVLPRANHALVETRTGLTSEMLRSDRFARDLFGLVGVWLEKHGIP
jgi:dienelactone hydrolase